jgi:hypothetical protein
VRIRFKLRRLNSQVELARGMCLTRECVEYLVVTVTVISAIYALKAIDISITATIENIALQPGEQKQITTKRNVRKNSN